MLGLTLHWSRKLSPVTSVNRVLECRKSLIFDLNDYFKEEFFETKKVVYLPS